MIAELGIKIPFCSADKHAKSHKTLNTLCLRPPQQAGGGASPLRRPVGYLCWRRLNRTRRRWGPAVPATHVELYLCLYAALCCSKRDATSLPNLKIKYKYLKIKFLYKNICFQKT